MKYPKSRRRQHHLLLLATSAACALTLLALTPAADAQTTNTPRAGPRGDDTYSLLPYTRRGYMGLNLGRADHGTPCGAGGFPCDNPRLAGKIYTGGFFSDHFGAELGYLHAGRADRGGGRTDAQGVNASLVARLPVDRFSVFAKGGITYGRTRVSASGLSGLPSGRESGWGPSYGVGAGYDFTRQAGAVLEWERHRMQFRGSGKDDVDMLTLGYVHRF